MKIFRTDGQSLVETLLLTGLISLGFLSVWTVLQNLLTGMIDRMINLVSLPIP